VTQVLADGAMSPVVKLADVKPASCRPTLPYTEDLFRCSAKLQPSHLDSLVLCCSASVSLLDSVARTSGRARTARATMLASALVLVRRRGKAASHWRWPSPLVARTTRRSACEITRQRRCSSACCQCLINPLPAVSRFGEPIRPQPPSRFLPRNSDTTRRHYQHFSHP
jgi:hypothetical protein